MRHCLHNRIRWISGLSLCLMLVFCSLITLGEDVQADGTEGHVIRIAGDKHFPPFEYVTESGSYIGFNVDIINAVSIETGLFFEFYPMTWNEALLALENGEVDAIQGMKYSKERAQRYLFSKPYFTSSQGIFILKDNYSIYQLEDLENRRVALQRGDIATELLDKLSQTEFILTDTYEEAINLLIAGEVDAFVGNRIAGIYFAQKNTQDEFLKVVGEPIDPREYGLVVLPQNEHLLVQINEGLDKIFTNGNYEKIKTKWLGEHIVPQEKWLRTALIYISAILFVILIISGFILWWNYLLKKEVSRRTEQITQMNNELRFQMKELEKGHSFRTQLLESAFTAFITFDKEGKITLMNEQANRLLGGSYTGCHVTELTHPLVDQEKLEKVLVGGQVFKNEEIVVQDQEEEARYYLFSFVPIVLKNKEITGAILNINDITEQKRIAKQLEQEDRLRSLGKIMLTLAHEIRNPLMAILTYTRILPRKIDNRQFREFFVEHVTAEIKRLNELIEDLLNYSKPKKSNPQCYDTETVLTSQLSMYEQELKKKRIKVDVNVEKTQVFADLNQLKQIFINIISNAIDASPEQGRLCIDSYADGEKTIIKITDMGTGLDAKELAHIFEPFYSSKQNGLGLGLAITHKLIQENKGEIDIQSTKGKGTTVTLTFPNHEECCE